MIYYTFHVNDSGAIEDLDEKRINGEVTLVCKMYDDEEFNKLNDILHSLNDYILNRKALELFKECHTIPYEVRIAKVLRKEKAIGFIKMNKSYEYFHLEFPNDKLDDCYEWIDFDQSEILAKDNFENSLKIQSHEHTLELIRKNRLESDLRYSFAANKVVFDKNFNAEIDLFKIPPYSWGVYVSERFKNKMEAAQITDIGFADSKEKLGKVWKPHFPIIEFIK